MKIHILCDSKRFWALIFAISAFSFSYPPKKSHKGIFVNKKNYKSYSTCLKTQTITMSLKLTAAFVIKHTRIYRHVSSKYSQ